MINRITNNQADQRYSLTSGYTLSGNATICQMLYSIKKLCEIIQHRYNHSNKRFHACFFALWGQVKRKHLHITLCLITSKHVCILHKTLCDITRHLEIYRTAQNRQLPKSANSDLKQIKYTQIISYYYHNQCCYKSEQPPQKPVQH